MICPEGCGHLGQAMPDTILKHPDCPFNLPVGFTVTNGDVVVDNAQLFTELCKAARKLGNIFYLDIV